MARRLRLDDFRHRGTLAKRLATAVTAALNAWGRSQITRLKGAFSVGGHQKHGGNRWAPPAAPDNAPVMVGSGRLKESLQHEVQAKTVTLIAAVPYASYHQEGAGSLPVRKIVVITTDDVKDFERDMIRHWNRDFNGTG